MNKYGMIFLNAAANILPQFCYNIALDIKTWRSNLWFSNYLLNAKKDEYENVQKWFDLYIYCHFKIHTIKYLSLY